MDIADIPSRFPIPFANAAGPGYIRPIPTASGTPTPTDAPASLTDGFPPDTFLDISAGGIPPNGADFNGILYRLSAWARWQAAGAPAQYNGTFSTAIGGYPKYALLASTMLGVIWQSQIDDNTTDPDAGPSVNWVSIVPVAASPSDFQTGTDNTKFLTADAMRQGMGATGNVIRWPNGVIEQWGDVYSPSTGEPAIPVFLPVAYSDATYNVQVTPYISSSSPLMNTGTQLISGSKYTGGFSVQYQYYGSSNPGLDGFTWRTIGR